ncbi:D-TA family PLP-dependent enzyme [Pricia sp. S334]|uniref:D-TA family PLP-dependent enzyme n=1 Tax=Pricia mediterranea TaxID=3076079 RepID=A0ABU3L409_9FLAO|nr:D-TA family PLP-dependent enzyme [Pricia sp. S334]MDT7828464.1 D-TA family PLP-dependent enzyme [Pricia sp. S334]
MKRTNWYALNDTHDVITPALLVYPDWILHNIRTMIEMAGGAERLRPHIKTHKTAEIIEMQLDQGVKKFKCATIAEAELLAMCNAPDILLAMQPVGTNIQRFFELMSKYPESKFSALVDTPDILDALSDMAKSQKVVVSLWMDINCGMNRTGILPDENAVTLYRRMDADPNVDAKGLHAYDGHIRNTEVTLRKEVCDASFATVTDLKKELESTGTQVAGIVAGGSPTFPFHARRNGVEASPGTTLLWDAGYGGQFPEMEFLPAAVLLTRVISRPSKKTICLDLGHKHLASEMPFPRVDFLNAENCTQKGQSEEHFVLECENTKDYAVGDVFYAVPVHICPTVAKYTNLEVVSEGRIIDSWEVAARNQRISI